MCQMSCEQWFKSLSHAAWQRTGSRHKQADATCPELKANWCSSVLTQLYPCATVCKLSMQRPQFCGKLCLCPLCDWSWVRNPKAELRASCVPAVCQPATEGMRWQQSWMEPCEALPTGRCSLQPSYFPGAVPVSRLHLWQQLHLPTGVQTLNGVLQMSDRLEMQILWHENYPTSVTLFCDSPLCNASNTNLKHWWHLEIHE